MLLTLDKSAHYASVDNFNDEAVENFLGSAFAEVEEQGYTTVLTAAWRAELIPEEAQLLPEDMKQLGSLLTGMDYQQESVEDGAEHYVAYKTPSGRQATVRCDRFMLDRRSAKYLAESVIFESRNS